MRRIVTDRVRPAISTKVVHKREGRKDGAHKSMPSFFLVEPNEWTGSILIRGPQLLFLLFSDKKPCQVISCHSFIDSVAAWRKSNMLIQCT